MNKYHENKLTMFEGVIAFLVGNLPKFAGFKALLAAITNLQGIVAGIKAKSVEVGTISAGRTKDKMDAEEALMDVLLPVKGAVLSWATQKGDNKAAELASITETKLRNGRDTELVAASEAISKTAESNAAELADFNVTAEMIADLKSRIDAFNTALGERESGVGARTGARAKMITLFSDADKLLEKHIDNMMEMYRTKDPELYNQYFATRVIKNLGLRHKPPNNQNNPPAPPSNDQPPSK